MTLAKYFVKLKNRFLSKISKTYLVLFYLLLAATVLFTHPVLAFFGSSNKAQPLIVEESLKAQFQGIEEKMLREGSYVYSSGYQFLGQISDFDEGFGSGELSGNILIQGIAFLSPNSPSPSLINGSGIFDRQRSGLATYEVQSGDTPSYIAASFGISTNTLLWANDLSYWSIIQPGQKLVILPTSGVLHEVTRGETLAIMVNKYDGDFEKTVAYNGLPANGSIQSGQKIVIPDGKKPISYQPKTQYTYQSSKYLGPYGNKSRRFPWGQCTWYVAQKRLVTWSGHAKYWLGNADAQGLSVCYGKSCEPKPGAIIATSESWYGHVAYIEAVNGNYITISEMHGIPYWNRGKIKTRVLNESDWRIRGYIY